MREPRVLVVGAGIAGLSAAVELAARGVDVTVLERAAEPGGKLRQVVVDGAGIDSGPTVFTMRWVFDELLANAGTSLDAELKTSRLDVLARHAWGAGGTLDLFADARRSTDAIAAFAGPAEARRFEAFRAEAKRVYATLEGPYIRSPKPGFWKMVGDLGPRGLATLSALGPFADLWRSLARHFHDPRLQQLFGRYATYCGWCWSRRSRWTACGRSTAAWWSSRGCSRASRAGRARRSAATRRSSGSSSSEAVRAASCSPRASGSTPTRWCSTATSARCPRACSASRRAPPRRRCRAVRARCRR
jgi:phytoene dehydrogenase-like protein